jgi:hypothetical protein
LSRHFNILKGGVLLLLFTLSSAAQDGQSPKTMASLPPMVRELTASAMQYMDGQWDEEAGLVGGRGGHGTRGSAQYAVGLMLRNGPGDTVRVRRIIEALARVQVNAPDSSDHGSWPAQAEGRSTLPGRHAEPSLDPNWREFIGSAQILLLEEFGPLLDGPSVVLLEQCIRRAAEGDHERKVRPQYSNIALMSAHLLGYAGGRFDVAAWRKHGGRLAGTIYRNFKKNGSLDEYNSPTYGGVDLYGLGLWRTHPVTPEMAGMAEEMEAGFWQDLAAFYHPGLRNLCGPFDRAYGMDMRQYVALAGVWIAFCVPENIAPLPSATAAAAKDGERFSIPSYALVRREPPPEILPQLRQFQGERQLRRPIGYGGKRVATAWLSKDLMIGGGVTPPFKDSPEQAHPATAHWVGPDGGTCWMRLRGDFGVKATAGSNTLTIHCTKYYGLKMGDSVQFEVHAPGARAGAVGPGQWHLPGLDVKVNTKLPAPVISENADGLEIRYPMDKNARDTGIELVLTHTGEQPPKP